MRIYFVEDCKDNTVYAIFKYLGDAESFRDALLGETYIKSEVVERNIYYGQPKNLGFNK